MAELWNLHELEEFCKKQVPAGKSLLHQLKPYQVQISKMGIEADGFLCPICHIHFLGDLGARMVSNAHVWPKERTSPQTILCKKCNNTIGAKFESKFTAQQEQSRTGRLGREIEPIELVTLDSNMKLKAELFESKGVDNIGVRIKLRDEHLPKQKRDELESIISGKNGSYQVKFSLTHYSRRDIILTYYSIAFLAMFRHFGYEFAFSVLGRSLQNAIWNQNTDHELVMAEVVFPDSDCLIPWVVNDQSNGVGFLIPLMEHSFTQNTIILPSMMNEYYDMKSMQFTGEASVLSNFEEMNRVSDLPCPFLSTYYGMTVNIRQRDS